MFSVIFPGQGSQILGMGKEFYENFTYIKELFLKSDELLKNNLSKIILEGPKDELDFTENTQPAIFLISYSIFKVIEKETKFNIKAAKYFAGHSLGEYSALCCSESISFDQTIKLLKSRGKAMQEAVPKGRGGMIAVLGLDLYEINGLIQENNKIDCYVANDNSIGQIVISGDTNSIELFSTILKKKNIRYVNLPVSAPFHCPLMKKATENMKDKIYLTDFVRPVVEIISNVTAKPVSNPDDIKKLLVQQIEKTVRWRESINNMINTGVNHFIEIGPGKVLSGLVKRIDRNVKINQVNSLNEINNL